MKTLIFLLVLFPSLALAYPAVGDFVQFEAKHQGSSVITEKRILSHDVPSDSFEVHIFTTYQEVVIMDVVRVLPRSFLYSPAKVENVLKTCVSREGMISQVLVDNKKLSVCEFWDEGSQLTYMIGPVPFGQVRFQEYLGDGVFLDFNLMKFTSN